MPSTARAFAPPHCPNARCVSHSSARTWGFIKKGFFWRDRPPHRIQRYRCRHCGRNFSSQTFSATYWLRRGDLLEPLFMKLVACSGFRQIARDLRVSHSTIQRLSDRLGRHCLLFHELQKPRTPPSESLVLDGFRSFEHSQYWPMDLNLLIGTSHFLYGFSDAPLRRSGTMKPSQRQRREKLEERLGRPDPQATRKSVEELLRRVLPPRSEAALRTDEHKAYPRAIARLSDRTIHHETTSSRAARVPSNPLFVVNTADHLIRHSSANHKRETIAFSKRRQSALYRLAVFQVWRNYIKHRSENKRDGPPARAMGILARALTPRQVLARRLFPERFSLTGWLERCYFGRIETSAIARNRRHEARYAA